MTAFNVSSYQNPVSYAKQLFCTYNTVSPKKQRKRLYKPDTVKLDFFFTIKLVYVPTGLFAIRYENDTKLKLQATYNKEMVWLIGSCLTRYEEGNIIWTQTLLQIIFPCRQLYPPR